MKIIDLFESFDSRYITYKANNKQWFITEDGETFSVDFVGQGSMNNPVEVIFSTVEHPNVRINLNKDSERFYSNRALKVLSTVTYLVVDYLQKNRPEHLVFTGNGQLGELYEKIVDRQFDMSEYQVIKNRTGRKITVSFVRNG